VGQDVLTVWKPILRHYANVTSETAVRAPPEDLQRPHKHWAQRLSRPAHSVRKRLFPLTIGNDVVSRNITMVLENLLKDYESSQLPTHGKGNLQNVFSGPRIFFVIPFYLQSIPVHTANRLKM
jgi:hypothetical protein